MLIFQEKWLSVAIYDKSDFHLYFSTIFVSNLWSEVIAPFTHIIIIALQLFFFTVYVCYPLWYDIESGRIQSSEGIRGFISNCNCLSVFSSYINIIFVIAAFSRLLKVYNLVRAFKTRWRISEISVATSPSRVVSFYQAVEVILILFSLLLNFLDYQESIILCVHLKSGGESRLLQLLLLPSMSHLFIERLKTIMVLCC